MSDYGETPLSDRDPFESDGALGLGQREADYGTMSNAELCQAAVDDWETPWFGAVPYVEAMREMLRSGMDPMTDRYYADSPGEIALRFLGNAAQWKGDVARPVKAEMRKRMGLK